MWDKYNYTLKQWLIKKKKNHMEAFLIPSYPNTFIVLIVKLKFHLLSH